MCYQYTFDCRTIMDQSCPNLKAWNSRKNKGMATIYTCDATNNVIFPLFKNDGKINQELVQIEPLFECPVMQVMRKRKIASPVHATTNPDGKTSSWNKQSNTGPNK